MNKYKVRNRMRCTSAFTLAKSIGRSSSETMSESVVVSLEGNADVFSPVCDPEIETLEDVGTCTIEVCLVTTLVDSPNR